MKWIRRALLVLLAIPVFAVAVLMVASQRSGAGRTREQLEIKRPPSDVFLHIMEPQLVKEWTGLAELELVGGPPVGVGSRFRAAVVARGRRTELETEVTAMEQDRLLSVVVRTKGDAPVGFTQLSQYTLEERDDRTRLTVTTDTSYDGVVPGLLEPLMTRAGQRELERQLDRLKAQVESREATATPPPAPGLPPAE